MRPSLQLHLRTQQSLVMTQALQQSIKLLQLSTHELAELVQQEIEKNPFLSDGEGEGQPASGEDEYAASPAKEASTGEEGWDGPEDGAQDGSLSSGFELEQGYEHGDGDADSKHQWLQNTPAAEKTLRQHLLNQWGAECDDAVEYAIGAALIDAVEETGYLHVDIAQVAQNLGVEIAAIEQVIAQLQRLEPVGVCARSVEECLSLQLRERNRCDPAMQRLLEHLPLLAAGERAKLQQVCGVDAEDLREMIAEIRALNPKPGNIFTSEQVVHIVPDVLVRRLANDEWGVELNVQALPRVLVNRKYYAKLKSGSRTGEDKKFLSDQLASASWLVKALDQRAQTILKVATEMVRFQDAFFRLGIRYLKPLTLREMAEATGYHESTISRVTTNKYLMSPRGLFELKYFFTSSLTHSAGGEDVSSQAVKHWIGEMIAAESAHEVLSDDQIAQKLAEKNINIARRTVAKYREALGIPTSSMRKRMKKIGA